MLLLLKQDLPKDRKLIATSRRFHRIIGPADLFHRAVAEGELQLSEFLFDRFGIEVEDHGISPHDDICLGEELSIGGAPVSPLPGHVQPRLVRTRIHITDLRSGIGEVAQVGQPSIRK